MSADPIDELLTAADQLAEDASSPLRTIAHRAALPDEDARVLALACAVELEPRLQRVVAHLHGERTRTRPSLGLLRKVFGPDHVGPAVVSASGSLRRAGLAHVDGDGPWSERQLTIPETVAWRLIGSSAADPYLPVDTEWIEGGGGTEDLLVVTGEDRTRRIQHAIVHLAADRSILVPVPADPAEWDGVIRQATVDGLGVIVDAAEGLPVEARWWIDRAWHLPWAIVAPTDLTIAVLPRRRWLGLRAPSPRATAEEVTTVAPEATERGHRFTADQLRQLRLLIPAVDGQIDEAVRRIGGGALDRLARRVHPQITRDDLVLGEDQSRQIDELIGRYRHGPIVYGDWGVGSGRPNGVSALFAGPPGTGKTAAAEVVAGAIGLDLAIVDLATVVSKYIGETEENLDRVFDAAGAGNIVLLFDEADALFGKRTEVSDSHDRYANLEISYLLQRIERFEGLVVLTTNYFGNIDQAFLRRITVNIEFHLPTLEERRQIWQHYLGDGLPLATGAGAVDVERLAERFEVAGAAIRNATIGAAFLAADAGEPVTMAMVQHSLRRELRKMGRLVDEADFA